jgi:hypothetical protein
MGPPVFREQVPTVQKARLPVFLQENWRSPSLLLFEWSTTQCREYATPRAGRTVPPVMLPGVGLGELGVGFRRFPGVCSRLAKCLAARLGEAGWTIVDLVGRIGSCDVYACWSWCWGGDGLSGWRLGRWRRIFLRLRGLGGLMLWLTMRGMRRG